jgi:potassium/hydrogen antiporter
MEPLATAYLLAAIGGLLILAGLFSPVSTRLGIPALLLFLFIGIAAGSEGIGRIPFDDYPLAFRLGTVALVLILFDGGLNTPVGVVRRMAVRAGLLATVSVLLTAAALAGVGILLGLPPPIAILVGAVVSSTDAAAVFSVLRSSGVRLKERVGATLEVESGLNDPMAVFLTIATTEILLGQMTLGPGLGLFFVQQMAFGVLGGFVFGFGGRALLRLLDLPAAGLYPVLTLALAFAAFGVTTLVNGSGFLAVYLTAILLAAGKLPYRAGVRRVHDALAWLSQMLMFLVLGLLVFPTQLLPNAPLGIGLALALALLARPLAVLPILLPFRSSWRERLFVSWVGLRGAVPIMLAAYPVLRGLDGGAVIFHLVFFIVLVNSLVPGATVSWLAGRLGLTRAFVAAPPAGIEVVSAVEYPGEFIWYQVSSASAVAGSRVHEIPIPETCVLTLLIRGSDVIAPRGATRLEVGDHVCVFVKPEERGLVDLLFGLEENEAG